jgi:hypothetical protein
VDDDLTNQPAAPGLPPLTAAELAAMPDPVVVEPARPTTRNVVVESVVMIVLGAAVAAVALLVRADEDVALAARWTVLLGSGAALLVLAGLLRLATSRRAPVPHRLLIGSEGIDLTWNGRAARIGWSELAAVDVHVLWAPQPATNLADRGRSRVMVRVRLAPVVPDFGGRADVAFLRTGDDPDPWTHRLYAPHDGSGAHGTAPVVETVSDALRRWSRGRYQGTHHQQVAAVPMPRYAPVSGGSAPS